MIVANNVVDIPCLLKHNFHWTKPSVEWYEDQNERRMRLFNHSVLDKHQLDVNWSFLLKANDIDE